MQPAMTDGIDSERLEQAIAWRVRLAESPELYAEEFSSWLARHPDNYEAWRSAQASWDFLGEHATSPAVVCLRRAALSYASNAAQTQAVSPRFRRFPVWVATAAVIFVAVSALTAWYLQRPDTYRTALGERRVVTLADDSQITLDSSSEVKVRYSANARALTLVRGQARFDVTHDVERPFTVTANGRRVVATGTAFDVDLLGSDFLVTLIEGHVLVLPQSKSNGSGERTSATRARPPGDLSSSGGSAADMAALPGDGSPIALDVGQQLVMSLRAAPRVTHVDVERVMAWERGNVVFNDEPLTSVVERMNRYSSHRIVVADERVAALRISGVFHVGDVRGFVSTLTSYLPVKAQEHPDGSLLMTYQEAGSP
jgi:transmembrane sensor